MRINKYLAQATGLSRRASDAAITAGRVTINEKPAKLGDEVADNDAVTLDGRPVQIQARQLIMLNKPPGYVCSRAGQGSRTIYDLLPPQFHHLKPIGRLDKDSSGLLLLTDDGDLANRLTHPRYAKTKVYEVKLDKPLSAAERDSIGKGIQLDDGLSKLKLKPSDENNWQITMSEGRNRQIRRTFSAIGHHVAELHRTQFGPYRLEGLESGRYAVTSPI